MTVVVDASALIDSASAAQPSWGAAMEELHSEHVVMAPSLLSFEVANVVLRRRIDGFASDAKTRLEQVEALLTGIDLVPPDAASRAAAAALVAEHKLTFYDAAYLALAASHAGAILVTQDAALLAAARKTLGAKRAFSLDDA